jgi:hypothetical protein
MARLNTLLSTLPPLSIPPRPTPSTFLSTFTLFPKLAPELRSMIWKYAASAPRSVRLFTIDGTLGTTDPSQTLKVTGQSKHPGIVHVCSESREAAMKIYERCSVTVISNVDGLLDRDTIYVNFAVDRFVFLVSQEPTVGFRARNFNFTSGHVKQIKNLEIEMRVSEGRGLWNQTLWNYFKCSNIASVWFTKIDWARNHSMTPNFRIVRCLEENYWNDCEIMEILKRIGVLLPELKFHWKATEEAALWPCAPIDNCNSAAETRRQLGRELHCEPPRLNQKDAFSEFERLGGRQLAIAGGFNSGWH